MRQIKTKKKTGKQRTSKKEPLAEGIQKKRRKQRNWKSMNDEELISHARKIIEENGIKNRRGLQNIDRGLYGILRKRNLLDDAIPEKQRNWSSMRDDALVGLAKSFAKGKGIKNRLSLRKVDDGLYNVLLRRKLLDTVFHEKRKTRSWSSMSDSELIRFAKKFIKENKIKNRKNLEREDKGLYSVLWERNLLNAVFSPIEKSRKTEAVQQVVDAMREYGGSR